MHESGFEGEVTFIFISNTTAHPKSTYALCNKNQVLGIFYTPNQVTYVKTGVIIPGIYNLVFVPCGFSLPFINCNHLYQKAVKKTHQCACIISSSVLTTWQLMTFPSSVRRFDRETKVNTNSAWTYLTGSGRVGNAADYHWYEDHMQMRTCLLLMHMLCSDKY